MYRDAVTWEYTHQSLPDQLDAGVRSFELDVYYDPDGIRVEHVPVYDNQTTCAHFVDCLEALRSWSKAHPNHVPIITLVELKYDPVRQLKEPILPFDEPALEQLEAELLSVVEPDHLIRPDDVRGDAENLAQAIRNRGWPTLSEARGKLLFVIHDRGPAAEMYRRDRPSLEGRAMFLESVEDAPYASVFVRNRPQDEDIPRLVTEGFIVRTRADSGLVQGKQNDTARRDAALASGAQIVSTDFPPGEAHPETGYIVSMPGGRAVRCNPVNGGEACDADALE